MALEHYQQQCRLGLKSSYDTCANAYFLSGDTILRNVMLALREEAIFQH